MKRLTKGEQNQWAEKSPALLTKIGIELKLDPWDLFAAVERGEVWAIDPIIAERGWAGHFYAASSCLFRRNTLVDAGYNKVVVSTVGNHSTPTGAEVIGSGRYYETMAFEAVCLDGYLDADISRQVSFDSEWAIDRISVDSDNKANAMHENVVAEIKAKLTKYRLLQSA